MAWRRTRTVSAEERRLLSTVMADEQNKRRRSSGAGLFFFGSNQQKTITIWSALLPKTRGLSRTASTLLLYYAVGSLFFYKLPALILFGRPVSDEFCSQVSLEETLRTMVFDEVRRPIIVTRTMQ